MARDRKRQRERRKAKRKQEINWGVLPLRHESIKSNGGCPHPLIPPGATDVVPHVASWNMVTWDGYSRLVEGFPIIETKDDRDTYIDKVREYREEGNTDGE